jgi:hypothetical protein
MTTDEIETIFRDGGIRALRDHINVRASEIAKQSDAYVPANHFKTPGAHAALQTRNDEITQLLTRLQRFHPPSP